MVSQTAASLHDALEDKLRELEGAVGAFGEEVAARRPGEGEWCCKEVLSHLLGDEGEDPVAPLRRIIDEDTPLIGIVSGLPYYSPARQAMSVDELRKAVSSRYRELAHFLRGLNDEQLARKARIPLLKETPIGEVASIAQFAGVLNFHLTDHINQIRSARQRVGA